MEYIKKEELKDGDVFVAQLKFNHYLNKQGTSFYLRLNLDNSINYERLSKTGGFSYNNIRLATPEEKHWLESCIEEDKFITFEEAVKTFIPEYVKLINTGCRINNDASSGKIYKCSKDLNKSYYYGFFLDNEYRIGFNKNEFDQYLKPSTKEAYDAQFIVKEPEFVLPEKWYVILNSENRETLNKWRKTDSELYNDCDYECIKYNKYGTSLNHINDYLQNYQEITFEQFKKYILKEETAIEFGNKIDEQIIEPLPQFKVIESIETITKVENNEGSQFFIGDTVKSLDSDQKGEITKFRYSTDKSNIIAITTFQSNNGIGINKIEHYIEPKVEVKDVKLPIIGEIYKEESLLEKAKRLYPVGTRYAPEPNIPYFNRIQSSTVIFEVRHHEIFCKNNLGWVFYKNKWAEIIEYPHGFKVGDKIKIKLSNREFNFVYKIIKIEGNVLFFGNSIHSRVLAKNVIKVN